MKKRFTIAFAFFLLCLSISAQRKPVSDYLSVRGYIKNLGIINFVEDGNTLNATSLYHKRVNLKIHPVSSFTIAAELRTRLFISEQQKLLPTYGKLLGTDAGIVDLSFTLVDKYPVILHTMLDRLYLDWQNEKWQIRLGRQRLNWGINLAWNPNDIFNTYNFLDFDYEERPGADALKVLYNISSFSNIELAYSPSRDKEKMVGAIKYAFNKRNYDFQVMAGNYQRDVFVGFGWAGNIKDAGFKGEVSYFQDWQDKKFANVAVSGSITVDYAFKKGWYMAGAFLYNNKASDQLFSALQLFAFNLSPKVLMPAKYNFLLQTSKQFSPASTGSVSVIYSPVLNMLIINPYISYSIVDNWDIDLTVQCFFADDYFKKFKPFGNSFNLRARWSFSN
ncbi:MAG: hypothetical protein KIS94_09135 [Chitinophagales bacterium]|nr:hypothetical protein [Chitinophagales bacterium]